jgi:hypothetical protein
MLLIDKRFEYKRDLKLNERFYSFHNFTINLYFETKKKE